MLTRQEITALPPEQFKALLGDVMAVVQLRRNILSRARRLAALEIGQSVMLKGSRLLWQDKQDARAILGADADWRGQATTKGVRATRVR